MSVAPTHKALPVGSPNVPTSADSPGSLRTSTPYPIPVIKPKPEKRTNVSILHTVYDTSKHIPEGGMFPIFSVVSETQPFESDSFYRLNQTHTPLSTDAEIEKSSKAAARVLRRQSAPSIFRWENIHVPAKASLEESSSAAARKLEPVSTNISFQKKNIQPNRVSTGKLSIAFEKENIQPHRVSAGKLSIALAKLRQGSTPFPFEKENIQPHRVSAGKLSIALAKLRQGSTPFPFEKENTPTFTHPVLTDASIENSSKAVARVLKQKSPPSSLQQDDIRPLVYPSNHQINDYEEPELQFPLEM